MASCRVVIVQLLFTSHNVFTSKFAKCGAKTAGSFRFYFPQVLKWHGASRSINILISEFSVLSLGKNFPG